MEQHDRVKVIVVKARGQFGGIDFREAFERFTDAVLQQQEDC